MSDRARGTDVHFCELADFERQRGFVHVAAPNLLAASDAVPHECILRRVICVHRYSASRAASAPLNSPSEAFFIRRRPLTRGLHQCGVRSPSQWLPGSSSICRRMDRCRLARGGSLRSTQPCDLLSADDVNVAMGNSNVEASRRRPDSTISSLTRN